MDYASIKEQCLKEGKLFEDPEFPASEQSISVEGYVSTRWSWKRPKELCDNPQFVVEGATRFDLVQGDFLGDCWFVAAAATLATRPELFSKTVPSNQDFGEGYAGIFHFKFWRFGEWHDIVVDDRLPVDNDGKLVFGHNRTQPNEFWGSLIEKAYAKLYGSYEFIHGGMPRDALVDFTGGIAETFNLKSQVAPLPDNLFDSMLHAFKQKALMGAGIFNDEGRTTEERLPNGLYQGHAYSITALTERMIGERKVKLLRLRNPWGEHEWNGPWGDGTKEWDQISEGEKQRLQLITKDDGEFWMRYEDFCDNFHCLDIVHLGPASFTDAAAETLKDCVKWEETVHHGSWKRGVNAGGCGLLYPYKTLYYSNPQYHITLKDADEGDDEKKCTLIVSLIQKFWRRKKDKPSSGKRLLIGFDIHRIKNGVPKPLYGENYDEEAMLEKEHRSRTVQREVSTKLKLDPGVYCIIPNTLKANQDGEFLLRVYTQKPAESGIMDEQTGPMTPTEEKAKPGRGGDTSTIKDLFVKYAAEDYGVDARDLRDILNEVFKAELSQNSIFSLEACRCLVSMVDSDQTGVLAYEEIRELWKNLTLWREEFKKKDINETGFIETFELRRVFQGIGFNLSMETMAAISVRYGGKQSAISFEDFVLCAARAMMMYSTFMKYCGNDPSAEAKLSLNQWMFTTLYY